MNTLNKNLKGYDCDGDMVKTSDNACEQITEEKTKIETWAKREVNLYLESKKGSQDDYVMARAYSAKALEALSSLAKDGHSGYSIGFTRSIVEQLAGGKERPNLDDITCEYTHACYASAYKAFDILSEDNPYLKESWDLLDCLILDKPLTPIVDTDDIWNDTSCYTESDEFKDYQCKRMSSLFKYVYKDGTVKYHDVDRHVCSLVRNPSCTYTSGLTSRLLDELYPITLPYMPESKRYHFYCEEWLTDKKNGDFDTVGVLYLVKPDGECVNINRFYKESKDGFVQISEEEYEERKQLHIERVKKYRSEHKHIFVVNGMAKSGKDTFANILNEYIPTYKYSSIDKIKEVAKLCGWDGYSKTEKDRKFLSDLKMLTNEYSDLAYNDIKERANEFLKSDDVNRFMLIDIREPEAIERFVGEFGAKTILIRNDNVSHIDSNESDKNVYNYDYDYTIFNNGTLEEFRDLIIKFVNDFKDGKEANCKYGTSNESKGDN